MSLIAVLLTLPIFLASGLKVKPGEDALLQCQGPAGGMNILLEWSRPELKSEGYVFFFRNDRPYEKYQHHFFKGRVELRDPSMKDGDVSVILRNVTVRDTGTYDCEVTTRNKQGANTEFKHSVSLTVTASDFTDEDTKIKGDKDGRDRDKTVLVIGGVFVFVVVVIVIIACVTRSIQRAQTSNKA